MNRRWAVLLLLPSLCGCSLQVQREMEINAPAPLVWKILTDFDRYPQWNPYHVHVAGALEPGSTLIIDVQKPNGDLLTEERYVEYAADREFAWSSGGWSYVHSLYLCRLVELSGRSCRLTQREKFRGLGVPFSKFGGVGPGYELINLALKERAEAEYRKVMRMRERQ